MCPVSVGTSRSTRALETGEAKLWVLLIGVNHYNDHRFPKLSYSALDCQGLGEAITAATQTFPQKSVIMHHDFAIATDHHPEATVRPVSEAIAVTGNIPLDRVAKLRGLPAQLPRLETIRTSLHHIVEQASAKDTILFYFSGHGILDPITQQAVLCLADTQKDDLSQTGLGVQELLELLSQCNAHQQIVWLDACHSGGMTFRIAKGATETEPLPNPTPQLMEVLRQRAAQSKGFYALLSCDQSQQSWEFPELGHGVFTYYLMRGLLGDAADAQGIIEADALYKYVYYQTLQYIDKTNQQLRLINQQKRGRGDNQLQQEYPQQTPKRIVEGVGELILGIKPNQPDLQHPRQALVVDGLGSISTSLNFCKTLRSVGGFELVYFPQSGKEWTGIREAIQACLQSHQEPTQEIPESATALLYLRGRMEQTETGDAFLVLQDDTQISRSWLRQELRRSAMAQQVIILDCPASLHLPDWIEDLQIDPNRGQCLIAAASPDTEPEAFAHALLNTLVATDDQAGLSAAGWIAQLQTELAGTHLTPHIWLSGSQGVIEILPARTSRTAGSSKIFDLGLCPYLGLKAFGENDAAFFFGRESLTRRFIAWVNQNSFLAVVGASGSGKSSVVQAGLLAQLRQGKQLPGSDRWWIRSLRPGGQPLGALAARLVDNGTEKERAYQQLQLEGILYQGVESFVYWLRSRPEPMLVLVIDQFEELFTLTGDEDRQRFLELVLGAVTYAGDRFKLIITLRTDFVAPCLEIPALALPLQQSSLLVSPHLSDDDYRQIITSPAEKVGLTVEPELVEVLLQELDHGAGDLPLLEFVLEQLWQHRQPGKLTLQVYQQQIGGLRGALERKAQTVYDNLDIEAQACARWIFLSLTQLGEGTEDTRRRILKSDLVVKKYPAPLVERVLQALTAAKLIVVSVEEEDEGIGNDPFVRQVSKGNTEPTEPPTDTRESLESEALLQRLKQDVTIEVAHEILIRHWSTLRWWLEENRSRLRSQRQIEQTALQWKQSGKQADFLLRGVRLDAAEELYVKYTDELSHDMQLFIEAGLQQRLREQQQAKQRLQRAQIAIAAISALSVFTACFGGVAYWQWQRSLVNEITALNALSESQKQSDQQLESLLTSLQAGQHLQRMNWFGIDANTRSSLRMQTIGTLQQAVQHTYESNRLEGHSERVNRVTTSADGQLLASGSDDATVRVWQIDGTLIHTLEGHQDRVTDVAFSADHTLASASADGTVILWNLSNGTAEKTLTVGDWITSIAWSPDHQTLVTGSRDRTVRLWDVTTGKLRVSFNGHTGWINTVAYSPNQQVVASADEDGSIRLWNEQTGSLIRILTGHQGRVIHLSFSPDNQTLASVGEDGTIKIWDYTTEVMQSLEAHTAPINSVEFSPDSQMLITASADSTLKLWRVNNGAHVRTLRGHGSTVLSASFISDSHTIVSSGADKSIRLWQLPGFFPENAGTLTTAFNSDGTTVASATWDGTLQFWQRDDTHNDSNVNRLLSTVKAHEAPITAIAYSSSGNLFASASEDSTIKLWNPITHSLLQTLTGHQDTITSISFSPNGKILASASEDNTIKLWNPINGSLLQTLTEHQDGVSAVIFNPQSSLLASGSYDNTIKLWRTDGTLLKTFAGHELAIASLAFHPDGQILASGSWDNTIKLWNATNGTLIHTLIGHQDGIISIAFSSDGKTLFSGSADRTIKLWNIQSATLTKTLLGNADSLNSLSLKPDGKMLLTSTERNGITLWNLDLQNLLQQGCDRIKNYLNMNSQTSDHPVCD